MSPLLHFTPFSSCARRTRVKKSKVDGDIECCSPRLKETSVVRSKMRMAKLQCKKGAVALLGGSGLGRNWRRPQITFKSCDVSPLLHFTPFSSCARRTPVKESKVDGDIECCSPRLKETSVVRSKMRMAKLQCKKGAVALPPLYRGQQRSRCALVHFTRFTSGPWK